jgi:phosphoribosylamine--glycine ligase/phosphoribosylformylglycinamidine cyclo-ligase
MADEKQIVLIVGSGGREHALAWKLSQSAIVQQIFVCPGNGGTAGLERTTNVNVPLESDFKSLVAFAHENGVRVLILFTNASAYRIAKVTLVVPGPEQPLVDGIETAFRKGVPTLALSQSLSDIYNT